MGKSRKFGSVRQDRLLGSLIDYNQFGPATGSDDSELGEEDVWSAVEDDQASHGAPSEWSYRNGDRQIRNHRRWVHGERRHVGGLSLAFKDGATTQSSRIIRQYHGGQDSVEASPPVNVPNWSMMKRVNSNESFHESDVEDESERVPPHEYLAREYARRHKMVATSVLEGVGRTLKGRDMSRVRDAVWSRTGFDG